MLGGKLVFLLLLVLPVSLSQLCHWCHRRAAAAAAALVLLLLVPPLPLALVLCTQGLISDWHCVPSYADVLRCACLVRLAPAPNHPPQGKPGVG